MRFFTRENCFYTAALTGLVILAFAAPSIAGTVYKWTTESGTTAFTDDPKRVPARYKGDAEKRQTGTLGNYKRLTVSKSTTDKPHRDRVEERLNALRVANQPLRALGATGDAGAVDALEIGIGGDDQIQIPIRGASDEPVTISTHRVKLADSIATQDVRIARRGDEVISRTISKRNEGPIAERP